MTFKATTADEAANSDDPEYLEAIEIDGVPFILASDGSGNQVGGNAGRDTFVFAGAFGNDEVTDFSAGAGGNTLDFSEIAEIETLGAFKAQAFSIAGNTIVTFDDANLSITLFSVHENDFGESNFDF